MNKYRNYLIVSILCLFGFITNANAVKLTSEELAEKVLEINPDATYVYVVGQYAYTSDPAYALKLQDLMLAARSIEVSADAGEVKADPIFGEMAAWLFDGHLNEDTFEIDYFEYSSNLVGTSKPKDVLDIKYIDYQPVTEVVADEKVKVEEIVEGGVANIQSNEAYSATYAEGTITLDQKKPEQLVAETTGTGLVIGLREMLKDEKVASIVLTYGENAYELNDAGKDENGNSYVSLTLKDLLADIAGKEFTTITQADIIGKDITMTVVLADGYAASDSETYTIKITGTTATDPVEPEPTVVNVSESIMESIDAIASESLTVRLDAKNVEVKFDSEDIEIADLQEDVAEVLNAFKSNENYAKVEISYDSKVLDITNIDLVNLSPLEDADVDFIRFLGLVGKGEFKASVGATVTAADLADKTIVVKITLADEYISENDATTETYNVNMSINEF